MAYTIAWYKYTGSYHIGYVVADTVADLPTSAGLGKGSRGYSIAQNTLHIFDGSTWKLDQRSFDSFRHTGGASLEAWYYANCVNSTAMTTGAPTANVLRALPFVSPARGGTLDRLGFIVTSGVSGNARIGLYSNSNESTTLYPGALLNDSGNISVTASAVKTYTLSRALAPSSLYWLAIVSDVAPTIRCLTLANCSHLLGEANTFPGTPNVGISVAHAFAALPSTFTAGGAMISATPVPGLLMRFSA